MGLYLRNSPDTIRHFIPIMPYGQDLKVFRIRCLDCIDEIWRGVRVMMHQKSRRIIHRIRTRQLLIIKFQGKRIDLCLYAQYMGLVLFEAALIIFISFIRDIIRKKVIAIGSTLLFSLCFLIFA